MKITVPIPLAALALAPFFQERPAPAAFDHTHAAWTAVLKEHARDGGFDYAALKKDDARLRAYLRSLEAVTKEQHDGWERDEQLAFWINAYNAYTIRKVVGGYPVKSIKKLGGLFTSVWDKEFIPLNALHPKGAGDELSLNDIEHGILRPRFEDARVHAAINCASKSCPPLLDVAYTAKEIGRQLERQVKAWLADPARNRFEAAAKRARVSKIFDWFEEDFERGGGTVAGWIAKYAPREHAEWLAAGGVRLSYLDYDWSLNDAPPRDR